MQENFEDFISKLQKELPDLVTPEKLLNLGLGNHTMLFRIRQNGEIPFLKLSSARILYLKSDVIDWLRKQYQSGDLSRESVNKEGALCAL